MHIGINAQLLSFSQSYRNGGISRYIRYLLTELTRHPGQHHYTVFLNGPEVVAQLGVQHPQVDFVAAPWPEHRPAARILWEQFTLPSLVRQLGIQVLHSPANVLPEFLPRGCTGVVTLHDLAFLRLPEVLTRSKQIYHRTFTVRSLRRASFIIADSDSTSRDLTELLSIPQERITTIYPCLDERFTRPVTEDEIQAFRQRQGIEGDFLLYMGTLEPRKNIPSILNAYARLRQMLQRDIKLVLAGGKGWLYDSIFAQVQQLNLEDDVLFPGYVSDVEQPLWYHAAAAFVYPSLYEGFGMPVTEALACGVPVITSTSSSLPEAGAGIALTVDPYDIEAMAAALCAVLNDPDARKQSRLQAQSVIERFSAATMVKQTLAVYEKVVMPDVAQQSIASLKSVNESKIGYGSIREQQ